MSTRLMAKLERLERRVPSTGRTTGENPLSIPDDDWLMIFEAWAAGGAFDGDSDFQPALTAYRLAVLEAKAARHPPYKPPASFMPLVRNEAYRWAAWRSADRFPRLARALRRLYIIAERRMDRIAALDARDDLAAAVDDGTDVPPPPTVDVAEFDALAQWFGANRDRLFQRSLPSQLLDLGDGRKVSVAELVRRLRDGPAAPEAGQLLADLHQVKAALEDGD